MGRLPVLARAAAHYGEEPCISGTCGSGAVFFSGCSLRCVFCQNEQISHGGFGEEVSVARLREIFDELVASGVHNINLVNPTHFAEAIAEALEDPLPVPVVYNSSGYERVETLRKLEGKIQIYMPDYKYALTEPARRYSLAADYPEIAAASIFEMFRQTGAYRLNDEGILQSGVLIRHLVLPGNAENSRRVIDWLTSTFKSGDVLFSLMGQYTPCGDLTDFPELAEPLAPLEYAEAVDYLFAAGWEDGYLQEPDSFGVEYIPCFDLTGVK
jgi:putative pyruvate formate lyase activating enzyme